MRTAVVAAAIAYTIDDTCEVMGDEIGEVVGHA